MVPAISHGMIKDNINVWLAVYFVDSYGIDLKQMAGFIFWFRSLHLREECCMCRFIGF